MKPRFFASPAAWRRWLAAHYERGGELWVGFYKRSTGRPSITWPESVDEALCFGWIDGLRKNIDKASYMIRFTPRRASSNWSVVNTRRVKELTKAGRMHPAGVRAYEARSTKKTGVYSFEQRREARLAPAHAKQFKGNEGAWRFFRAQPPGYQRIGIWWIVSAKREETKQRRLLALIELSAAGRRLDPMAPGKR